MLIIILIASLFMFEDVAVREWLASGWEPDWPRWARLVVALGGFVMLVLTAWGLQRRARRRIEERGDGRAVIFSERVSSVMLVAIVVVQIGNLAFLDWLGLVREWVGDWVLVDELLVIGPALLAMMGIWGVQYPVSRLVREATLMRHLDRGLPIYPIWKRGQFVLLQVRLHFVLMLLPILLMIGWREMIEKLALVEGWPAKILGGESAEMLALGVGMVGIFLLAPLIIRYLWDTQPLPEGEIRTRLLEMCATHRLRVRELLVWNTFGAMMNGAVMGVVGRMRYILLTDALLDTMSPKQIESVMAHELGHVRRRHLPGLILALMAILLVASVGVSLAMSYLLPEESANAGVVRFVEGGDLSGGVPEWLSGGASLMMVDSTKGLPADGLPLGWVEVVGFSVSLLVILMMFGWVSRRFERQADTFAVQHLSGMTRAETDLPMTAEAVAGMAGALGLVAALNHIPVKKRSWRHGSIAWRQRYLRSLVGRSCKGIWIDRQVFVIKLVSLLIVAATLSFMVWDEILG